MNRRHALTTIGMGSVAGVHRRWWRRRIRAVT